MFSLWLGKKMLLCFKKWLSEWLWYCGTFVVWQQKWLVWCVYGEKTWHEHDKLLIQLFIVTVGIMGFNLAFSISVNSSSSFVPSAPPTFSLTFCKSSKRRKKNMLGWFFFFKSTWQNVGAQGEVKTRNSPNSKQVSRFLQCSLVENKFRIGKTWNTPLKFHSLDLTYC